MKEQDSRSALMASLRSSHLHSRPPYPPLGPRAWLLANGTHIGTLLTALLPWSLEGHEESTGPCRKPIA